MAANAAHSSSGSAIGKRSDIYSSNLLVEAGGPGSHESLIVESGARRLLKIRHWNQAHPAARTTPAKHRVLAAEIRSSGMPAQTNLLANVLSGESPNPRSTPLPGVP